jgi:hypothetical protein
MRRTLPFGVSTPSGVAIDGTKVRDVHAGRHREAQDAAVRRSCFGLQCAALIRASLRARLLVVLATLMMRLTLTHHACNAYDACYAYNACNANLQCV